MGQRLDKELVDRALAPTRNRAQQLIASGAVLVNGSADKVKASLSVSANDRIELSDTVRSSGMYVSRGAIKLVDALDTFIPQGLPAPREKKCLDIGASTGGFTQVLLDKGAQQVIALDVGHGQLDPLIANDNRVIEMSGVNIRDVYLDDLEYSPRFIVSDVSFISLTYVIPVIERITHSGAHAVVLVKPQFEVGPHKLGKGGIVTDTQYRQEAIETVQECAVNHHFTVRAITPSTITGTHGNQEYILWITRI
ncbi:TlyA family RNA methyltransferase [Alloscardovia omnicolens]|uniref:TlyA family RNA methyltransferase n=1 Tax=Alloscardovia omnicolens TaxID=419015 RepID=UPI002430B433|nr:TlyA family RNA methyltransferase [Alloscardovia omnicolens]MBS6346208.1 TlyA family RNA methyltransferase [Alloscardovia omnicolens]